MGIRSNDRNLASIPLGHSYGLGNFMLPLILQGTPLVCATHFVPHQLIDWIRRYRITIFPSVPAIFRVLGSMPAKSRLTPLRLAISAGAPLTAEVARAFFERYHLKIHNFYGSSETGGICYDRTGAATLNGRSVGKPLRGVAVTVNRGVIEVASAAVAKRNGSWRMPDRGEWNKRGELVLFGRRGREINIGGKKVHPSEVEEALRSIPGVSDAIIWGDSNSDRIYLHAAVETRLPLVDIQRALSARLAEWKLPKHYLLVTELPRNGRGKVDMAALRLARAGPCL
jgi:acyl-coenzyme A synthetase/AMP-(fatty) acid ligase